MSKIISPSIIRINIDSKYIDSNDNEKSPLKPKYLRN